MSLTAFGVLFFALVAVGILLMVYSGNKEAPKLPEEPEETYTQRVNRESREAEERAEKAFMATIREPVLSFLKVFKEDPKRFRLTQKTVSKDYLGLDLLIGNGEYELTDLVTGEVFRWHTNNHSYRGYRGKNHGVVMESHLWLESNEVTHLNFEMREYFQLRKSKLNSLKSQRRDRVNNKERARLKKVYGGEV